MQTEEFFLRLSEAADKDADRFHSLQENLVLGCDKSGQIVAAHKGGERIRHTAVTGVKRTEFIRRTLLTAMASYDNDQAAFYILSPKKEYGELLRFRGVDITVPFLRSVDDLWKSLDCLRSEVEFFNLRNMRTGWRLFLVVDGLETLGDGLSLDVYTPFLELATEPWLELITGVELMNSVFESSPSAFVGRKNCLVATVSEGKADVTYVGEDMSMSLPEEIIYPAEPSVTASIHLLSAAKKL
jgi:hypothetical protein